MIFTVVGARPNFMKMAPIVDELRKRAIPQKFIHTGQHYDAKMSQIFFDVLKMPTPDFSLGVGSGSHAEQTAKVMIEFDKLCTELRPDMVVVAGDVNSTLACALVASKLTISVAHIEAGLRSFDRQMPEEINRILTDHISDLLFTTESSGNENLRHEGIEQEKIRFVGNTMIDTLFKHRETAVSERPWLRFGLAPHAYGLVTLHRPSNVDDKETAIGLARALEGIGQSLPLLFPIHPRTLAKHPELWQSLSNIRLAEPLDYLTFLGLMANARVVITDSGGIQEETTALGIKCVTVRENTERPITITHGTNYLVSPKDIEQIISVSLDSPSSAPEVHLPPLWDGQAAKRVVDEIEDSVPTKHWLST